jgi:hypothetical protein
MAGAGEPIAVEPVTDSSTIRASTSSDVRAIKVAVNPIAAGLK